MKSNKRKKKINRFPLRLIVILLILIAASALVILSEDLLNFEIPNPFIKTDKSAYSSAILKQVRDISRLNTIEFIYKSVFPYDLIDENTDWGNLVNRYNSGERLTPQEFEILSILGISTEAGINLLDEDYSFAVITARIRAGFDFTGTVFENPEINPEKVAENIIINSGEGIIQIKLPPAVITEVIIDDADSSSYEYPDLKISPEHWKTLTTILSGVLKTEAAKRGIAEIAEARGQDMIRGLLEAAGYNKVEFIK
jgi:hypothetical protein